jgi:hypothetical protein
LVRHLLPNPFRHGLGARNRLTFLAVNPTPCCGIASEAIGKQPTIAIVNYGPSVLGLNDGHHDFADFFGGLDGSWGF